MDHSIRIALIGYGKMGKAIEEAARSRGHIVTARLEQSPNDAEELGSPDVAIEFTVPSAAAQNIKKCFAWDIPIVVGTTGWYDQYDELSHLAKTQGKTLFSATNFSLGVNIFFRLNQVLAEWMKGFESYDVRMEEIHHIHKLDAPSGTAITLADTIVNAIQRKKSWIHREEATSGITDPLTLEIVSHREAEVPGTHSVTYENDIDRIYLEHEAKNRTGFALGAVLAAEFAFNKKGVFGMNDLLGF